MGLLVRVLLPVVVPVDETEVVTVDVPENVCEDVIVLVKELV